jgi:hypothetical protein
LEKKMTAENVVVTQTKAGEEIEYRGPKSRTKRTIRVNREWSVSVDGEFLGTLRYSLVSRERRSEGKRYVNARWDAPAWTYLYPGEFRGIEAFSKADAIDRLVSSRTL